MNKLISLFPRQLMEALKLGQSCAFPQPKRDWHHVVISGLGGSGIGGTIVQNYVTPFLTIPLVVNKTHYLPGFVNNRSLVIICSYSGNTGETVQALRQALEKKAFIVCIASGGEVGALAETHRLPFFKLPAGMPPRSCLGYSLTQILFALHFTGLIADTFIEEIKEAATLLRKNKSHIRMIAAALAQKMYHKIPVIYAPYNMEGVAVRWRQQFNENSKTVGWENVIPEMNHNELVGWRGQYNDLAVFFLHNTFESKEIQARMAISKGIVQKCTETVFDIYALGEDYWQQIFSLIHIGDCASWYLAQEKGIDATEVDVIDYLKGELATLDENKYHELA